MVGWELNIAGILLSWPPYTLHMLLDGRGEYGDDAPLSTQPIRALSLSQIQKEKRDNQRNRDTAVISYLLTPDAARL